MMRDGEWIGLQDAWTNLHAHRELRQARLDLIEGLQQNDFVARAAYWKEVGEPWTWKPRARARELSDGFWQIPADFWDRAHAWSRTRLNGGIVPTTTADWRLSRFETTWLVYGGRPNWQDQWGLNSTHGHTRSWSWHRLAIGIEIQSAPLLNLLRAYSLGSASTALAPTGYITADEELVQRGIELVHQGVARSAHHAAQILSSESSGASREAIVDRLGRRMRKRMAEISRTRSFPKKTE